MTMFDWLTFSVLFVVGFIASVTDIRERKIYNIVSYPSMLLGFILWSIYLGLNGLFASCTGFIIALGVYLIVYFMGGFGAGDVKFAAAIGSIMGYPLVINWLVISAIMGGVFALALLVRFRLKKEGRFEMKESLFIPFGPPMTLAILITYGYNFYISMGV